MATQQQSPADRVGLDTLDRLQVSLRTRRVDERFLGQHTPA